MLAAAADFLTGSASPAAPAAPKEKLGGEMLITEDGRRLGLNSPIREHGRIVEDRLRISSKLHYRPNKLFIKNILQ